jgi:hypothetical protein
MVQFQDLRRKIARVDGSRGDQNALEPAIATGSEMAARIEWGRAQLLTRTGLDWTDKYPCCVGEDPRESGLPRRRVVRGWRRWLAELFADSCRSGAERGARLVYYECERQVGLPTEFKHGEIESGRIGC